MNTGNFLIEDTDLNRAKEMCRVIEDDNIRARALANNLAAEVAIKYFTDVDKVVDSLSGLHNISTVVEDIEISDLYLDNNYIDVRFFFNGEELLVPTAHFENKLLPVAYMFVNISDDLSNAEVSGFIYPENIDTSDVQGNYYKVDVSELISYYDVESRLFLQEDTFAVEDKEIYDYLDGNIGNNYTFYQKLIRSKDGRERLAKSAKAKVIFNLVSIPQIELVEEDSLEKDDSFLNFGDDEEIKLVQEVENEVEDIAIEENESVEHIIADDGADNIDFVEEKIFDDSQSNNDDIEVDLVDDDINNENEVALDVDELEDNVAQQNDNEYEEVDMLFEEENSDIYGTQSRYKTNNKSSVSFILIALVAVIGVVGGIGYWYFNNTTTVPSYEEPKEVAVSANKQVLTPKKVEAMPIESVEAPVLADKTQSYGISESIPAIEQDLDASILVSNLKVDWEVPAGYVSNTSVKRYLVKLGKIIQLNLKTELLLLSKPPITNKIAVEIHYNSSTRKFETVGVVTSSGEKSVDNLILSTVQKALLMHINTNSDSFANLKGNPILVIHL